MSAGIRGTHRASAATARNPIPVTAQNVARQPSAWPRKVPNGTPRTLASVSPANIRAIAEARWLRGTTCVATTEPMPKKAAVCEGP